MPQLTIRVGASVDRSVNVAFQPLIEGAKRGTAAVETEMRKASRAISTETRRGTKDAEARYKELEREIMTGIPRATDVATAATKKMARETAASFSNTKRSFADLAREAEAAMRSLERTQRRMPPFPVTSFNGARTYTPGGDMGRQVFGMLGGREGVGAGFATAGRLGLRAGRAAAHAAMGMGLSFAHGIGVDTDLGSIFHKNAELESGAIALSNASVIKEDPRNAQRVDPRELMRQVLDTSAKTGTDANTTLEGLRKFVDLTGDLATGREIIGDMEKLAKATGTSMEDMIKAAGEIALALGPSENKVGSIKTLMNQFAAQGERGANALRLVAPQMAKIASSAGQYEGDRARNIALLGVLGQEARIGGGAATTAQAATAVAGLTNTFKTPARAKAFKAATGQDVFNQQTGLLKNPEELIIAALRAKGMDPLGFKGIFANIQGARAPEALATIYRAKGGGQAGEDAVRAELKRLMDAYIDEEQMLASFRAAMGSAESQAHVFNNAIREAALQMQDALLPAAAALAPVFVDLAGRGAHVMQWLLGDMGLKGREDKSGANVDKLVENTRKQIDKADEFGHVTMFKGQRELNAQAEGEAASVAFQANEALKEAQAGKTGIAGRAMGKLNDVFNPFVHLGNYMSGDNRFSSDAGMEKEKADIAEKQRQAKEADEKLAKIHEVNQETNRLLRAGILNVKVVEPIPGEASAPGKPKAGRSADADEAAER